MIAERRPAAVVIARGWAWIASRALVYLVLIAITLSALVPILWMVATSLKTEAESFVNPWLWPHDPTIAAYMGLFQKAGFGRYVVNSLIVGAGAVGLILLVASMAAFGLVRYELRAGRAILVYFLLGQMIPTAALIVPLYLGLQAASLINTYQGLILAYTAGALPVSVFMIRGFFRSVPPEIAEAAVMDGCNELRVFWHVYLPLGAAGLATVAIFEALSVWSDFLLVLVVMQRSDLQTLTVAVFQAVGEYGVQIPSLFAGLTISVLPLVVIYLVFTRRFIAGLTAGALKG